MVKPAVVLHLSDIQFGAHHRFTGRAPDNSRAQWDNQRYGSNQAYTTLFSKLEEDLRILKEEEGLAVNILVVSGDLAEWSLEDEYANVTIFLDSLLSSDCTELSKEAVILVPGNHDVNWWLCEAHFLESKAHRKTPAPPYWPKFRFWQRFFEGFLGHGLEKPWCGYDLRSLGIILVGLNSCMMETHRDTDHYGWLGIPQVKEATDWLRNVDQYHSCVRVAVVHHNVLRASDNNEENLRDWDDVQHLFQRTVDIVLHGHRHGSYRASLVDLDERQMHIFGAGSAGLDGKALPDSPNQYQIIKIDGRKGTLYLRGYNQQAFGSTGKGMFRADSDEHGCWKYPFTIRSLSVAGRDSAPMSVISDSPLARVEELKQAIQADLEQRLLREREKVGSLIGLKCFDIRSQTESGLSTAFDKWFASDISQMVVLGAAGSGKTISCLEFCQRILGSDGNEWIPVYLDLGRFAANDDALDIIAECFRTYGASFTRADVIAFIESRKIIFCLDAFDEYERGGFATASDRSFEGFGYLRGTNTKVLLTCRTNFFRRPEDIFFYELRTHEFELCPSTAVVVQIMPLDPAVVSSFLQEYVDAAIPDWLSTLVDRPLYLRMLVPLLRVKALDISESLERYELYENFVSYILSWDLRRRASVKISMPQSRDLHVTLAERFLNKGVHSLADVELFHVVEQVFGCQRTDSRSAELLFFFKESGLLRFEGGRIVFSHKSFREYIVAKKIFDLISVGDDSFGFIWFTRNEREFILEMLSDAETETLCRWLNNEDKYPACNYACFILGGTKNNKMIPHLEKRLNSTKDSLIKINCANALAALGENNVCQKLVGAVAGYALAEGLCTLPPTGSEEEALGWVPNLSQTFGRSAMLVHLCESIDALAMCGDESVVDLLRQLENAPDKCVVDEAKGALRRLVNRLGSSQAHRSHKACSSTRKHKPRLPNENQNRSQVQQ